MSATLKKTPKNWMSIFGNADIKGNSVTLLTGVSAQSAPDGTPQPPHALLKCDVEFEQGAIECEIYPTESASRCQLVLTAAGNADLFSGINIGSSTYGFAVFRNNQWEPLGSAGQGFKIQPNRWYSLKLVVSGSILTLHINDVEVVRTSYQLTRGQIGIFMQGMGSTAFRNVQILSAQPVCFVVMQFTSEFNELFTEVIRPTCEDFGYKVVRADDYYRPGLIIEDITRSIREASVVIADVTPNNANVFYEVGFAHGIDKPTILLSDRKRDPLPFDISGFRTLFYDNTIGGKSAVQERLRRHLESIVSAK